MNLLHPLRKAYKRLQQGSDLALIRTSGLFDGTWYLAHNPDVAYAGVDPLLHFLRYGWLEGRNPGPDFDTGWYLGAHEDVRKAGMNPLVHFIKYGQKEGRQSRPPQEKHVEVMDGPVLPSTSELHEGKLTSIDSARPKVFCIGLNKTGTTSLEHALMGFGYKLGVQVEAASLMDDWAVRDFRRIVEFCRTAEAFQDVPFSLDFTYQVLDYAFPGSKFILTVRNSAEEWYQSLVRFHSQLMGVKGIPTVNDVRNFHLPPHDKEFFWRQQQNIFGVTESTLYDHELYGAYYTNHNRQIVDYFKFRPQDLLQLNLSDTTAMQSLCDFLDIKYNRQTMPHLNKSTE